MRRTFPGGIHPPTHKALTAGKSIRRAPLPDKVIIPLIQHTGAPCMPTVQVGDSVKRGQCLGASRAMITSPIHASISGTVKAIGKFLHPTLGQCQGIAIEGDGKDTPHESMAPGDNAAREALSADQLRDLIKQSGIVGLGGAAFPTHVKLTPPQGKLIDTLLINGVECEPYLTCDHQLMLERAEQIVRGIGIVMKILNARQTYIAIEDNKMDAVSAVTAALEKSEIRNPKSEIHIVVLKTKYPQGGEKQLIKAVMNREVPPGKLPFEVGCVVSNVGTVHAISEAVYEHKPLYERLVTVSGASIGEPQNLLVRLGTSVADLANICGGITEQIAKVIIGGPMTGIAHYTLEIPVIKGTSGIVFLPPSYDTALPELPCIKCGRCADICPMNLLPTRIVQLVKKERLEDLQACFPTDCIECGACSYECPSKLPLVHYIKLAKTLLAQKERRR